MEGYFLYIQDYNCFIKSDLTHYLEKMKIKEIDVQETKAILSIQNGHLINESNSSKPTKLLSLLKDIFLPQGYPDSVSDDYMDYQIWDTLQELCSSLNGTLASHAVFKGMGVGDDKATALGATFSWLLKDGTGMVSNILFAWVKGTELDIDAKRWRLFADVVNDLAMMIDLLSPLAPSHFFTPLLCFTSICRSLVGVSGGCTRATIKQHQAKRNNAADVSAKDSSQAQLSNLIGLLLSFMVINIVSSSLLLTWCTFLLLAFLHLFFNYKACSCLVISTLNPSRYSLVIDEFLTSNIVAKPDVINRNEPFILGPINKFSINMGASMRFLRLKLLDEVDFSNYLASSNYLIYKTGNLIRVCFKINCNERDILEGFYFAHLISRGHIIAEHVLFPSASELTKFSEFYNQLKEQWDTSLAPLGTTELRFAAIE